HRPGDHVMPNLDQDSQSAPIRPLDQSVGAIHSRTLSSAGRRRTQEHGQGDLDDDWQDTTPPAVPEGVTDPGQSNPEGS
ncbi:MAG TPA: hypothetical protein VFO28_07905, partial [Burkholderiaceae bacterium]|nr:hypothetical protein [Burkholderiaceae bacterium]